MTFTEPTRSDLKTLAGWSLSRQRDASPAVNVALGKLRDGCHELIEAMPGETLPDRSARKAGPDSREASEGKGPADYSPPTAEARRPGEGNCRHPQFDIKTQRCVLCNLTYLQARGANMPKQTQTQGQTP